MIVGVLCLYRDNLELLQENIPTHGSEDGSLP